MYSMDGFATAFGEMTLVLFTTLAPSGAMAYVLMALPIVFRMKIEDTVRHALDKLLSIPILVTMIGLVASATHLGNPANVLYVLTGFGRSPLSNEVVCGVAFLGSAGVFWLTAFSKATESGKRDNLRRVIAAFISVLGLIFIGAIALAYDANTIITWSTPFTPASIWFNALTGGPLLALAGCRIAQFSTPQHKLELAYLGIAVFGCIASILVYIAWDVSLPTMQNSMTSADTLAPMFGPMIVAFAVLCAFGIYLGVKAVMHIGQTALWVPCVSAICALAGIFIMRFSFYMIHMTVGLGV